MSRLNYNKWDNLQLSDDSDIEVHPNVDKKSMIRWKQRDIHEKREQRRQKLEAFKVEEPMNVSLIARIDYIIASIKSSDVSSAATYLQNEISKLKSNFGYTYEEKKFAPGEQPSEDHMIVSLLSQVVKAVKEEEEKEGKTGDEQGRTERIAKTLDWHKSRLLQRQEEIKKEKVEIAAEQKKWITSEDIRDGWDSKTMVSSTPSAQPKPSAPAPSSSSSKKKTETKIETLNSPGVQAAQAAAESEQSSSDEELPTLTPSAIAFSKIPPFDWDATRAAISADPSLLSEETGDALMVEAFNIGMKGTKAGEKRVQELTEKALLGQYCRQLGRDGVALFFQRMTGQNPQALRMFLEDVAKTSSRIIERSKVVAAEQKASKAAEAGGAEGVEQIQLVPASENQVITFEVPDGPPPENLEITGEGSEDLDPEMVKQFLQKRWDIFESFPKNLKKALGEKSLEKVNKVLGKMSVEDAEEVVGQLQEAGILSFETNEIVDQTGQDKAGASNPTVTVPVSSSSQVDAQPTGVADLNLEDQLD
ncbi:Hsp90 co-chaperone CDC37 [Sporobolomyces salmoneus]|uniref:Hsp90 co-chaperone CDC37 n=1 Tax=Sporobolomyces salmoneus TaxID=183962 RepID=UPI003180E644